MKIYAIFNTQYDHDLEEWSVLQDGEIYLNKTKVLQKLEELNKLSRDKYNEERYSLEELEVIE